MQAICFSFFALEQCVPQQVKIQLYTSFPLQSSLTCALQHAHAHAIVSSSTTASILLLHTMVHSSTSNHCIRVVLPPQLLPSLPSLLPKSSSTLVCSPSSQLHCWAGYSNPRRPTPLFDELRLPQGTEEPIGSETK